MVFVKEKAYAKINLYLDIEQKRKDGFHDIITVMQLISLHDEVNIAFNGTQEINLTITNMDLGIPNEKNIAYIAACKFYENLDFKPNSKVDIFIEKHIPVAAGLAGGSADAAAVLRGLNYLYGKPFTTEQLCEIGLSIGSDVPFCIVGGVQLCRGQGEKMVGMLGIKNYRILIACSEHKSSTADQYKKLDDKFNDFKKYQFAKDFPEMYAALSGGRIRDAYKGMFNIFEEIYDENSTVKKIKKLMYDNEASFAMLSGSGPAVFGAFSDMILIEDAQEALAREGIKSYSCFPINKTYEYMLPGEDPWK